MSALGLIRPTWLQTFDAVCTIVTNNFFLFFWGSFLR
jgi:hypothetical protein